MRLPLPIAVVVFAVCLALLLPAAPAGFAAAQQQEAPPPPPASEDGAPRDGTRDEREPFGEAVDVRLTELYVVVTDADGNPVRGLTREDFRVRENGEEQRLDGVLDAGDRPLTLGLAVDTSASMFVKLPAVSRAARSLVASLVPGRDRAFVVAFGPEPRLVQETTGDLAAVSEALRDLQPRGRTPLWESIGVSLEELAPSRDKRALVVFFDGADDDGSRAYRRSLAEARRLGVPVYLIIMNNEAARTRGREFQTRSFIARLDRMAAAGGGEVYFLPTHAELDQVYQRIEEELRSYYLITYYPDPPRSEGRRRRVEVEVPGRKVTVRTLAGYEPGDRS